MHNKTIRTVGTDDATYKTRFTNQKGHILACPYYRTWTNLLQQCFYANGTPKDTTMPEDWLVFSLFREWMTTQDHTDKVLLPDLTANTRCFTVNSVFVDSDLVDLLSPSVTTNAGIKYDIDTNKHNVTYYLNGTDIIIGKYYTFQQAVIAREAFVHTLTLIKASEQSNPVVRDALLSTLNNYHEK